MEYGWFYSPVFIDGAYKPGINNIQDTIPSPMVIISNPCGVNGGYIASLSICSMIETRLCICGGILLTLIEYCVGLVSV